MTLQQIEALKLALEALELLTDTEQTFGALDYGDNAITAIKEALAEHAMRETQRLGQEIEQAPVAYDKTEMNCFVQDLYDKKMQEGKHGHYETMFHVVHQAIKKVPPQRTWVGLTAEEVLQCWERAHEPGNKEHINAIRMADEVEQALKEKNT